MSTVMFKNCKKKCMYVRTQAGMCMHAYTYTYTHTLNIYQILASDAKGVVDFFFPQKNIDILTVYLSSR